MKHKNRLLLVLITIFTTACGGGGGSSDETTPESAPLTINVSNFDSNVRSYEPKTISVTANYNCSLTYQAQLFIGFHPQTIKLFHTLPLLRCLKRNNSI